MGTGTGRYGACRSTQCCLAVWSRWVESSTRLGGFRALKKTTEAPYTTKVNNRIHTSRGTTRVSLRVTRALPSLSKASRCAMTVSWRSFFPAILGSEGCVRYTGRPPPLLPFGTAVQKPPTPIFRLVLRLWRTLDDLSHRLGKRLSDDLVLRRRQPLVKAIPTVSAPHDRP